MAQPESAMTGSLSPKLYIETIHELRRLNALGEAGDDPTKVAVAMLIRMVQFFQHDPLVREAYRPGWPEDYRTGEHCFWSARPPILQATPRQTP